MQKNIKFLLYFIFILILIAGCAEKSKIQEKGIKESEKKLKKEEKKKKVVEYGDLVEVDYIMKTVDGEIVDSSIESMIKDKSRYPWLNKEFYPIYFEVGAGEVLEEVERGIIGLGINESKEIYLGKVFGEYNKSLISIQRKIVAVPKIETLPAFSAPAKINESYIMGYWVETVINATNESVTVKREILKNEIETDIGTIKVKENETHIIAEIIPILNKTVVTISGFFTVIGENETHIIVDRNHPLAGKELKIWVKIRDIIKKDENYTKILWNVETNSTIKILYFCDNSTACLFMEKVLNNPWIVKESRKFTWIKAETVDSKSFNVTRYPTLIFLKHDKEIKRIEGVVDFRELKKMLEEIGHG